MPIPHKPLPYPSDALEPHIDKMTMEIHHGRHYKTYVDNYNKAVAEKAPQLEGKPLHEVLASNLAIVPEEIKTVVRNNGGGAHNHALFWEIMGKGAGGIHLLLELVEAAKGAVDRLGDVAYRLSAFVRPHDDPEHRMVGVSAAIVADRGADGFWNRRAVVRQQFFNRLVRQVRR